MSEISGIKLLSDERKRLMDQAREIAFQIAALQQRKAVLIGAISDLDKHLYVSVNSIKVYHRY